MKQNYKIFLLVAEELSYSKAAKKAYVTQQCEQSYSKVRKRIKYKIIF